MGHLADNSAFGFGFGTTRTASRGAGPRHAFVRLLAAVALLVSSAVGTPPQSVGAGPGNITGLQFSTTSLSLGDIARNQPAVGRFGIRNVSATGEIDVQVPIVPAGATFLPTCDVGPFLPIQVRIADGATCEIEVTFSTVNVGVQSTSIDFVVGSQSETVTVTVNVVDPIPSNDAFVNATDLSALTIPAFVEDAFGDPINTVGAPGTTVAASVESGEYGWRSVWYSFTSPPGGFTGRLGYRIANQSVSLTVSAMVQGSEAPSPATVQIAAGNTATNRLRFVRMEPGHTVWFSVSTLDATSDGSSFDFQLFQAPNAQDSIVEAQNRAPRERGDGDTFHLTAQGSGAPDGWSTMVVTEPGLLDLSVWSETAGAAGSARSVALTLYRSPTLAPVTSTSELAAPVAVTAGSLRQSYALIGGGNPPSGSFWVSELIDVPIQPGRYYWSYSQGSEGPTWFGHDVIFEAGSAPPPPGPCVLIDSGNIDFGDVTVGADSASRNVTVRSCSSAPIDLAVSVTNATRAGSATTWLASTAAVLADGTFRWSVTPPGAGTSTTVGPVAAIVGPSLSPTGTRTDSHRLRLAGVGPDIGSAFTSTITYIATAVAP